MMLMDQQAIIETLKGVSTATITTLLLKKGLRNIWMRGPRPQREGQGRVVGPAFTLRFIPAREDLATPKLGRRRARPALRSSRCHRDASWWGARWESSTPAFSATFSARGWSSGRSRA